MYRLDSWCMLPDREKDCMSQENIDCMVFAKNYYYYTPADRILQSSRNSPQETGWDHKIFLIRIHNRGSQVRKQPRPCTAPRDLAACSTKSPLLHTQICLRLGRRSQPGHCVAQCVREPVQNHHRQSFASARAQFECNRARSFRCIIRAPLHVLLLQHPRSLHVLQRQHTITLATHAQHASSAAAACCDRKRVTMQNGTFVRFDHTIKRQ